MILKRDFFEFIESGNYKNLPDIDKEMAIERALKLARFAGLSYKENLTTDDGKPVLYINSYFSSLEPNIICHDVAHYQLAPSSRRNEPEFGLGSVSLQIDLDCTIDNEKAQKEELLVSVLGIAWSHKLKIDWRRHIIQFDWHHKKEKLGLMIDELQKMGFLDEEMPIMKFNP